MRFLPGCCAAPMPRLWVLPGYRGCAPAVTGTMCDRREQSPTVKSLPRWWGRATVDQTVTANVQPNVEPGGSVSRRVRRVGPAALVVAFLLYVAAYLAIGSPPGRPVGVPIRGSAGPARARPVFGRLHRQAR